LGRRIKGKANLDGSRGYGDSTPQSARRISLDEVERMEIAENLLQSKSQDVPQHHDYSLMVLDGIDETIAKQLKLFNVTTVAHMAAINPFTLFINSPYGISQIVSWIDQSIFLMSSDIQTYNTLREYGINSATALLSVLFEPGLHDGPHDVLDKFNGPRLIESGRMMRRNPQYRRLEALIESPVSTWTMEALAQSAEQNGAQYTNMTIMQRFNHFSPLILPGSVIIFFGCLLILLTNFDLAVKQVTSLIITSAIAQTGSPHVAGIPASARSIIACFLALGILITLCVCLYAGFVAKRPSQRAADAVRTILSFSFGIVTGALSGSA
jgi:hypothetical protein